PAHPTIHTLSLHDALPIFEDVARQQWRTWGIDASWPARKDETLGLERGDAFGRRVVRDELAIDVVLAHAPRDELGVLRAEVDDRSEEHTSELQSRGHLVCR